MLGAAHSSNIVGFAKSIMVWNGGKTGLTTSRKNDYVWNIIGFASTVGYFSLNMIALASQNDIIVFAIVIPWFYRNIVMSKKNQNIFKMWNILKISLPSLHGHCSDESNDTKNQKSTKIDIIDFAFARQQGHQRPLKNNKKKNKKKLKIGHHQNKVAEIRWVFNFGYR